MAKGSGWFVFMPDSYGRSLLNMLRISQGKPPWKVENAKCKVQSAKWKMENGKCKMQSRKWKMQIVKWKMQSEN